MEKLKIIAVPEKVVNNCSGCVMNPSNLHCSPNSFKCDDFKESNGFGRGYSCDDNETIFKEKK